MRTPSQPGLLWMLQTAAGVSMAAPMVVVGVEFLGAGRYGLGAVLVGCGAVALFAPSYVLGRIGGPRTWIRRRLRRRRSGRGTDESSTGAGDEGTTTGADEDSTDASASSRLRAAVGRLRR